MAINFPSNPSNGDTHAGFTYSSSVGAWRATAGVSTTLSNTAPSSPSDGDLWWNTNTSKLYISYDDGSSTQWVQAAVPGATGATGADGSSVTSYANTSAFPSSGNSVGDFAFATNTKAVYIWDGSEWDRISAGVDESPVILTEPPTTHELSAIGSNTTLTMLATDPEGFDITYGIAYKNAGSTLPAQLLQTPVINQSNGLFTFTPTTNTALAGDFTARLSASDGVKTTTRLVDFSLGFFMEMLLAGGGGGGNDNGGGGGGAGGLVIDTSYVYNGTTYDIVIGQGGTASQAQDTRGVPGSNTTISQSGTVIYNARGGGGGGPAPADDSPDADGGSGAGTGRNQPGDYGVSTQDSYGGKGFGNRGGDWSNNNEGAGGGGGAGGVGDDGDTVYGGDGGAGKASSITGSSVYYSPGGPGGGYSVVVGSYVDGSASSYGAGGAGGRWSSDPPAYDGANGVVIIATQSLPSSVTGGYSLDTSSRSGYNVYTFTSNGSITF
jgi:hypothetical protein